jgi:hypothetical protein
MSVHIDWEIVDDLLIAGCDGTQIAAFLGCHEDTLYIRCQDEKKMGFSAYKAQKRSIGDIALLKAQYEKAVKEKDNTMLIFLGKARLNQSDKQQIELSGNPEAPVTFQLDERFTKKD